MADDEIGAVVAVLTDGDQEDLEGSFLVDDAEEIADAPPAASTEEEHFENLVPRLSEDERKRIGALALDDWQADCEARRPWEEAAKRGKEALSMLAQLAHDSDAGGTGDIEDNALESWQSKAVMPLAIEACTRLAAMLQKEVFPPGDIFRGYVIGEPWAREESRDRADRVAALVNELYSNDDLMPDGRRDIEKLVQIVVEEGGAVREPCWSEEYGYPDVVTHTLDKVWLPADARSLHRADRVTFAYPLRMETIRYYQETGYFASDVDVTCGPSPADASIVDEAARTMTGFAHGSGSVDVSAEDDRAVNQCGRQFRYLRLPDEIDGGRRLPYKLVITESGELLRLERDWDYDDVRCRRRNAYEMYGMIPVPRSPYPVGLPHILSSLAMTATDVLRQIIDATHRSMRSVVLVGNEVNLSNIRQDMRPISPNGADELIPIECAGTDLRQAMVTLRNDPQVGTALSLLGLLVERYEKAANTAEMMSGTAAPTGPVGTAMILVEQGMRVYSSFHARVHASASREARMVLDVMRRHMSPDAVYPMRVALTDDPIYILPDLRPDIDIRLVSSPNEYSATQRLARAQVLMQTAQASPNLYDMREVHVAMLSAAGFRDVERFLPRKDKAERHDVVTENQRMLLGQPVRAFMEQNHEAHIAEHERFFQSLPEQAQSALGPVFMAHGAEHMAFIYRQDAIRAATMLNPSLGQMLVRQPPLFDREGRESEIPVRPLDPVTERMLDEAVAKAMAVEKPPQPRPDDVGQKAEMIRANAIATKQAVDAEVKKREDLREQSKHKIELEIMRAELQKVRTEVAKMLQEIAKNGGRPDGRRGYQESEAGASGSGIGENGEAGGPSVGAQVDEETIERGY